MKFNIRLVVFLALSIVAYSVFASITIHFTDKYYVPLLQPFGRIFWLGLLLFILPLFVTREQAFDWFQNEYVWITFLLFALHVVLLIIATNVIVNSFQY